MILFICYCGFLHLYLWQILVRSFLSLWCLCLVLLSGQSWPHRMSWKSYLPLFFFFFFFGRSLWRIGFLFLFFLLFRASPIAYGGSQARGWIRATPVGLATATATQDPSHVCSLHDSHGNARSLTHWGRPGIEPATSWFLVGFVSDVPQRELPLINFYWLRTTKNPGR